MFKKVLLSMAVLVFISVLYYFNISASQSYKDTTAPVASMKDVTLWCGECVKIEDFVEKVDDESQVTYNFVRIPETSEPGVFDVYIHFVDENQNACLQKSVLTVVKDDEAPVLSGLSDKTVYVSETISYRTDVTVSDNRDKELSFSVDSSSVDLTKAGVYEAIYTATDSSGNTTVEKIKVTVKKKPAGYVSEAEVYELADKVIKKIIKEDMTQREKCRKIFNWVKSHVYYFSEVQDSKTWTQAAKIGFKTGKGDCYNFFAVTKALLDRAGVENMDMESMRHKHYWNFVKVEEGWYHLDTTPRSDHPDLFLRTDAWIDAYSKTHYNCFAYSKEGKPASAKK